MIDAIVSGFRGLLRFSGRDRRGRFWPYALVIVAATFVGISILMGVVTASVFADAAAFAKAHPESVTVTTGPGHYSVQYHDMPPEAVGLPDFQLMARGIGGIAAVAVILLAAAVTRRLHDTGRAGWWGLPPAVLLLIGMAMFPTTMRTLMAEEEGFISLFLLQFATNALYMLSLMGLVVLLLLDSAKGPNRFGPPTA